MFTLQVNDTNTVFQLAVALNLACVAAFKSSKFGTVIEDLVLPTSNNIANKSEKLNSSVFLDKKSLEEINKNAGSDYKDATNEFINRLNAFESRIVVTKSNIEKHIIDKCTPKFMSGICTYLGVISLIYLFINIYNFNPSFYTIFTLFTLIGIIFFFIGKIYYKYILLSKIDKLSDTSNKSNVEIEKQNKKLDHKKTLSNTLFKLLGVKYSFIFAFVTLCLSELTDKYLKDLVYCFSNIDIDFVYRIFINNSFYIPYFSFVTYFVVILVHNSKRNNYIEKEFNKLELESASNHSEIIGVVTFYNRIRPSKVTITTQ